MADPKRPLDPIAGLLEFAVDVDQTPEEAEQELIDMGVDVVAFLARARERRAKHAEEERTAWLRAARERLRTEPATVSSKYEAMARPQLVAEYSRRQRHAQAFFHKLAEVSDEDLRTLLMDLDDLDEGQEDPT